MQSKSLNLSSRPISSWLSPFGCRLKSSASRPAGDWARLLYLGLLGLLLTWNLAALAADASSPSADSILLGRAQEEFSQRRYGEALVSFRNYLRLHPDDQDAWTRFGATYYHTGQAKQALVYLRRSRPTPALRNYNQFYQALCYDALGDRNQSGRLLNRLVKLDEAIAEDALFEKAANRFEDGDAAEAKTAAEEYLKRFREGRYREAAESILRQLPLAGKTEVPESQRARYRKSYFEQHPLSIMPLPHVWYYQLGYTYVYGERSNPTYEKGIPKVETGVGYEQYKLTTNAGIAIGPFTGSGTQSFVGYAYAQDWLSDADRMQIFAKDPLDLQYFPFRPDLMERSHRLFAETSGRRGDLGYGAYLHWEFKRSGSLLFPAPERPEIRKAFDVSSGTLAVPWVEWSVTPEHKLKGLLYMEKILNKEQPDYSFKTYNFATGSEDPFLSISVQEQSDWPTLGLRTSFELFRWQYLYNDFWESYTSTGLGTLVEYNAWTNFKLSARASVAQNEYNYDTIKTGSCNEGDLTDFASAILCKRNDQKVKMGFSLSYINARQQAFSALVDYRRQSNATLKVYNESALEFLLLFSHSFPSLNSSSRFAEPYRGLTGTRGVF